MGYPRKGLIDHGEAEKFPGEAEQRQGSKKNESKLHCHGAGRADRDGLGLASLHRDFFRYPMVRSVGGELFNYTTATSALAT